MNPWAHACSGVPRAVWSTYGLRAWLETATAAAAARRRVVVAYDVARTRGETPSPLSPPRPSSLLDRRTGIWVFCRPQRDHRTRFLFNVVVARRIRPRVDAASRRNNNTVTRNRGSWYIIYTTHHVETIQTDCTKFYANSTHGSTILCGYPLPVPSNLTQFARNTRFNSSEWNPRMDQLLWYQYNVITLLDGFKSSLFYFS